MQCTISLRLLTRPSSHTCCYRYHLHANLSTSAPPSPALSSSPVANPMVRKGRAKQKKAASALAAQASPSGPQQPAVVSQKSLMQAAARKALAEQASSKQRGSSKGAKTPYAPSPSPAPTGGAGSQSQNAVPLSPSSPKSRLRKAYLAANEQLKKDREEYFRQATLGHRDPHHLMQRLLEDKRMGVAFDPFESSLLNMPNFDTEIPLRRKWSLLWKSPKSFFQRIDSNWSNFLKNATSMYTLAYINALPGVALENSSLFQQWTTWIWRCTRVTSLKPKAWIAGTRAECADTYTRLANASALGDLDTVVSLSTGRYRTALRAQVAERRKSSNAAAVWGPQSANGVRVVSVRSGFVSDENSLLAQAIVRFDAAYAVYPTLAVPPRDKGRNEEGRDRESERPASPPVAESSESEPRRVVEYILMENRVWKGGPWVMKERLQLPEGEVGYWD